MKFLQERAPVTEHAEGNGLRCRFCYQPVKVLAWRCGECGSGFATPFQWGPRLAIIIVLGGLYLWSIVKFFGY